MKRRAFALISLAGLAVSAPASVASDLALDFGISDQASYEAFRDAVTASEYVRYDYIYDRRPRVVGTATALMAYATRNPLATEAQLAAFRDAYDAALASYAPGDADLLRPANLLPAIRFTDLRGTEEIFEGTDTAVGEDILRALGIAVPEARNFETMRTRMVEYDQAITRGIANSAEWSTVLVLGLAGRDLEGQSNPHLAGVFKDYLVSQGYEPEPDGIDDERFEPVELGLALAFPADYASFESALAQPVESSDLWFGVNEAGLEVITAENLERVGEIQDAMDPNTGTESSLIESVANANDPAYVDQLAAEIRSSLDEYAEARTRFSVSALLLAQNEDPAIRSLALQSRSFGGRQLQVGESFEGVLAGISYAQGAVDFVGGILSKDPGTALNGLLDVVGASIELAEIYGGTSELPSQEQQIFDEITALRDQVEEMRAEMNQRFDRIESQLNTIYETVSQGFNAIGDQIGDLSADVQDLNESLAIARASLDRIEAALWGVAEDILLADMVALANELLDYRSSGSDLPYANGAPNFVSGTSEFFGWATSIAKNTTFAGDQSSTLTVLNAADRLNGSAIGRNINDLRVQPTQFGLSPLWPSRLAAPAPWAQAASAYRQMAAESPWYFAYMFEQQGLGSSDLDDIIATGEAIDSAAANARSQELFDRLFDDYESAITEVGTRVDEVVSDIAVPGVDPFAGLGQNANDTAPPFTVLDGYAGLSDQQLPSGIGGDAWEIYGDTNAPAIAYLMYEQENQQANLNDAAVRHRMTALAGPSSINDVNLEFRCEIGRQSGGSFQMSYLHRRDITFEISFDSSPMPINNTSEAQSLIEDDFIFWTQLRTILLNGANLAGSSYTLTNINNDIVIVDFLSDAPGFVSNAAAYAEAELDDAQDAIWTALSEDPIVQLYADQLSGLEALIDAYATLGLPELFERSTIARAGLRANPESGELSLAFPMPVDELFASFVGDGDDGEFYDIESEMMPRVEIIRDEFNTVLALPASGHSFVDWTLAELRDLRDHAFGLAIDDAYSASPGTTLVIDAENGLLANDISQEYRVVLVDASFVADPMFDAPDFGSLSINDDGSFAYTPDAGFTGTDSFTYRAFTGVGDGGTGPFVYSDPATVVIRVGGDSNPVCPGDVTGDGATDLADLNSVLGNFGCTGSGCAGDATGDGTTDLADLNAVLTAFGTNCS